MFKELSIKQIIQIFWEGESPTMKEVIKEPVMKQIPTCLSFSFLIDCNISVFFSVLIKAFANFEKMVKISLASLHCIQKWSKFENAVRNILPKTYSC